MIIQKNQTLYKCSFCGRRKLTRGGCLIHEQTYCTASDSPHMIRVTAETKAKQASCTHKTRDTIYRYIPGEAVQEPNYDVCVACNARL